MFSNLQKAFLRRKQSSESLPLNETKEFEFIVTQRVYEGAKSTVFRKVLHVGEDGVSVTDQDSHEVVFYPFYNIKTFYVSEESSEWKMSCATGRGNNFEMLAFKTPRANDIQLAVAEIIQKVVRDRRAMTM